MLGATHGRLFVRRDDALIERVEVLGLRRKWIEPTPSAITAGLELGAVVVDERAHVLGSSCEE
ncbi:MAG TPA: hypothetical protein VFW02_11285 [Candidatus Limnocylindrales bacterium]|nr:hypothetical protein [Candidatus Limnocylindrales bacterium]